MAGQLIFDEESMINGNIFKFEQRLHSHMNKFVGESGAPILTTYFSQDEEGTTVDRGSRDIDALFGKSSPIRHNMIKNFPMYDFSNGNPENTDEEQIEDINVNGECTVIPSTVVPKQYDFFIINHLKMDALFEVTQVVYDSMKVDGFYRVHYRLVSTSKETIENLKKSINDEHKFFTDLNAVGSDKNPIIREKDFVKIRQIEQMVAKMIEGYRALFYNERHNCFLYHDPATGMDIFDMCGNEFIAKHGLMNSPNSTNVIMLHDKISDKQMPFFYNNSVYNWLEIDAPERFIQQFFYILISSNGYPYSSFFEWGEEVQIIQPIALHQIGINSQDLSIFDNDQMSSFMDREHEPVGSEYDKLIWKFIHKGSTLSIDDISLYTADTILSSSRHRDIYLYTPMIIFIIRKILRMN